jgi:hypothetical protein
MTEGLKRLPISDCRLAIDDLLLGLDNHRYGFAAGCEAEALPCRNGLSFFRRAAPA